MIIRTLDYTSKFFRRNLKRGGVEASTPITYPINSVRSPFVNSDFLYWIERGKNFANTNSINEINLRGNIAGISSQNPAMFLNLPGLINPISLLGQGFNLNQDRAIAFWVYKQPAAGNYQAVVTKDSIRIREWQITYINDGSAFQGQLVLSVFNSSPSIIFQIGSALTENTWQHWVFNYAHSTATVTLYRDGVSVGSGVITGSPAVTLQNVWLGAFGDVSNGMTGYMSQVILANRTFTVSEINTLYNSGNGYFTI
jgi:hypothetical protein